MTPLEKAAERMDSFLRTSEAELLRRLEAYADAWYAENVPSIVDRVVHDWRVDDRMKLSHIRARVGGLIVNGWRSAVCRLVTAPYMGHKGALRIPQTQVDSQLNRLQRRGRRYVEDVLGRVRTRATTQTPV